MFDTMITRLFPAAMVGGIAVYTVASMLWLQPVVERRMAEKYLIPACEAGLTHSENTTPIPRNPERDQLMAFIQLLESSPLGDVEAIRLQLRMARERLRSMTPTRMRISGVERTSVCSCAADKTFEAISFPGMTLHVASARTYNPSIVQRDALEQSTRSFAISGQCGDLPWKG
ncbi:hypothetical protein [Falsiruegeria litorea]|uniref:hypothetical protein n=1 Tax=Falsiruegeria litorea TaxID=1280831 RepID=UPI001BFCDEE0|nr:hypothetical protein [Falsiruegeria litorea]MBT8167601.1 hypothetical protein [Falsiruegeria litorea]